MPTSATKKKKVLLIGWDGADWEHINPLLDRGLLPNIEKFINEGVMGNLSTLQPVLSPMLWNTIATAKLPDQHGICGFMEPDPVNGGARPVTSLNRKVKAIWNILNQEGYRSNVVAWWASHPAEPINGNCVSINFKAIQRHNTTGEISVPSGCIHPVERSKELGSCRVFPNELIGADILPFIPDAARIDQRKDRKLESLMKIVADCASVQAFATTLMADDDWDFTAVYFDGIDHFCHSFMHYHPPKMPMISDADFALYRHVINAAYQFHDLMLAALCQLAGDDCLVILCSDHGFNSGAGRPIVISSEPAGPAEWHRDYGIVAMRGPNVRKDERIYGANIIDITPTILAYLGLPVGADMQGRPLLSAFENPPEVSSIPSWEDVPGDSGMHPPGTELEGDQSEELRKQFVALGYVEDHGGDKEKAEQSAQIEMDYNLARVFLASNRPEKALPLCERLVFQAPWEHRFTTRLATCYYQAGYHRQCLRLIDAAYPSESRLPVMMQMLRGRCHKALGDEMTALQHFETVLASTPRIADLHVQLGRIFLSKLDYPRALASFNKAIAIDPEKAIAHQGLANTYLKMHEDEKAADAALSAVSILHQLPRAHLILGQALARLGEYVGAAKALEIAVHMRPGLVNGHRLLARLYATFLDQPDKAVEHREKFQARRSVESVERRQRRDRSEEVRDLPEFPSLEERKAILEKERPWTKQKKPGSSGKTFVLVSGLPRSGTSLMMQMLAAGGLAPMTDGQRVADDDNPEGYYEWEAIKDISQKPELLEQDGVDEKAIKVISMLLPALPIEHEYKIVFMMRPVEQIASSQAKMIDRLGTEGADVEHEEVVEQLASHRNQIIGYLRNMPNSELLTISYPNLIDDPQPAIEQLREFLGDERLSTWAEMAKVIRPELHRQKSES